MALPPQLKAIQHYLRTAQEHDQRDPVVSYYCRLYAMQTGMKLDSKTPECRKFLVKLMDQLESMKKELSDNDSISQEVVVVGNAHIENYALKMFLYADNEDRAGRFHKNMIKSFYSASLLMDVLSVFGELSEENIQHRKYARWKATYIHNCLKNGETPQAGPIGMDQDGEAETEQPLAKAPWTPYSSEHPHTEYHEGHGRMPSPDPQSTCGLVGQTPINPQAPCGGYRAGPVFHDQDENRIVPPESEWSTIGRILLSSTLACRPSREAEKCDPPVVGTHSPVPLCPKEGPPPQFATHQRHCPQPPCNVAKACQPRQPHNIQRFEDSFFSLTASLTSGVHHRVRVGKLPPRQAPETLRPQLRTAASVDNGGREHGPLRLNVMSPASLGICEKLFRRDSKKAGYSVLLFGPVGTNNSKRPIPDPKAQGSDPLVHRSELQHMAAELGSYKQAHTSSPPPLTLGNSRGSGGSSPSQGAGFQSPSSSCAWRDWVVEAPLAISPRLLPKPHCTGPSWTFLRVVSLLEGGPTSPFRAEPGQVPWAKTRPPGARLRAPTPGLAPGWGPDEEGAQGFSGPGLSHGGSFRAGPQDQSLDPGPGSAPGIGFTPSPGPGPSGPPTTNYNNIHIPPGAHAPANTPAELPPPSAEAAKPVPAPRSVPTVDPTLLNAQQQGGVHLTPEDFTKAQKYCKYAGSALQYEDVGTAVQNLQKALKLLTTGKE
ncbi:hypothetical protein L3Q82_011433 [Scortum barcoo]|uniref:Uncharacterized protein n=1 Tax=Scortum barcoo TaxID=214431 RepID=A0ACB8WA69_9TELE|nr:hypothetical protein L3Q82_011433 [Scortum barcoo]